MKIAILTQPLHNNYGGLLQAFALQKVLVGMGHEPLTVSLPSKKISRLGLLKSLAGRIIRKYILKQPVPFQPNTKEKAFIAKHTAQFIRENIQTTQTIPSVRKMKWLKEYNFDAYVVGSDQVWRPRYSPGIPTFFLNFVKNESGIKRISYAASFGVDHWEFKPKLTPQCRNLAQKFDAISVREDSAVKLCKEYLGVDAMHVLDPTMLLEKQVYITLIEKDKIPAKPNTLLLYVLDQTSEKMAIAEKVKDQLGLVLNSVMPENAFSNDGQSKLDKYIFPPVTQWLRGFMDAEIVVTDSFHACVFSIIFNKPFFVFENVRRGSNRINSLLKMFKIEERQISSSSLSNSLYILEKKIDWESVNKIREVQKNISIEFLKRYLY